MDDDDTRELTLYRLSWRWRESGVSGSGPWTHRSDVVKSWLESMVERDGESVDHWIEQSAPRTRTHARRGQR